MTIIAVTLNESGTFTIAADKLVGSNRRWIGERDKIHTHELAGYPNVPPSVGEN